MRQSRLICPVLVAILTIINASDNAKRAPSGFQGVRGKKSIQDTYPDADSDPHATALDVAMPPMADSPTVLEKRAPSAGFHGMRGKKIPFAGDFDDLGVSYVPGYGLVVPKRAPMGFMGMRGKKDMEIVGDEFEPLKRAPNMGFLGMRGKKMSDDEDLDSNFSYNDYYMEKRAPNMGFLGMRGKKEFSPFPEEEKRAPADGFFGMRGKKQPGRSSFFGMRGKKYPYEFRGKFVGVRGKKDSHENALPEALDASAENYANDLDLNELMMLLTEGNSGGYAWQKRKGPSGFMGMRG